MRVAHHSIDVESGLNKVDFEIVDKNGEVIKYAFNVYCDVTAPEITLTNPATEEDTIEVEIEEDVESYTVTGIVKDDMFGYNLYVNGENILNVMINIPEDGQYQLRTLVWDSFDSMNNLSDTIEYIVQP